MKSKEKNYNEDLCINRGAVVKINKPSSTLNDILEIKVSLCVVPNEQYEPFEYDEQVKRIRRYSERSLRRYIIDNGIFCNNSIVDVNFTSANLRVGYYKNVQMSVFAKQKNNLNYDRLVKRVKETIKPVIKSITDRFNNEGYVCHKKKKEFNKKTK